MKDSRYNIIRIVKDNLCIGCGLCTAVCSKAAIAMHWDKKGLWRPDIDANMCIKCSYCYKICPQSPERIAMYANNALTAGVRFGLSSNHQYFICYDRDQKKRRKSASGGALTVLLEHLLTSNIVNGIIASHPITARIGEPHYQVSISRTSHDLQKGRSAHYHVLSYHEVLKEISDSSDKFALVGVPCIMRGIIGLPIGIQEKIKYKICLSCGRNAFSTIIDYLAFMEGISENEAFFVNLRDKIGIPDSKNYNIYFNLIDREIRKNRFKIAWTELWRNYYFTPECCLYCPDFYGVDADLSAKDAWGRLSGDPSGTSLLIVRNPELTALLYELKNKGSLYLESCCEDEIFNSQVVSAVFKHIRVQDRIVWKKSIRCEIKKESYDLDATRRWWRFNSYEHFRLKTAALLSEYLYVHFGHTSITIMLFSEKLLKRISWCLKKIASMAWRNMKFFLRTISRFFFREKKSPQSLDKLSIVISGGYGYGNIGDEAQLAANIKHWRETAPSSEITVLTPNTRYTRSVHTEVQVEPAPRISLFGFGGKQYFGSERRFKKLFFFLAPLYLLNARLIRAGLPVIGIGSRQARLLDILYHSNVLFLSGGGYLTGMTWTRLWDNLLLIKLAHSFGSTVLLSGQTIGVFNSRINRLLARWSLTKAELIYLRDPLDSSEALASIGVNQKRIECTFDDALFFPGLSQEKVFKFLKKYGIDSNHSYLAVNVHFWGQDKDQSKKITKQVAAALDQIQIKTPLRVVFIPMVKSDETALHEVADLMKSSWIFADHGYNLELSVGLIANATLCLTMKHHPIIFSMGACVPAIAMAFDDYYLQKNRGALNIFGLEDFNIKCETEILGEIIVEKTIYAYHNRKAISKKIGARIEQLRPRSGEVITRWLKSCGLQCK